MNWLSYLMRALQLMPLIVAGIEHIHGEAPGATKKQMAVDALQLATGSAEVMLPQYAAAADAASQLTSGMIDGLVDVFHKAGVFGSKSAGIAAAAPAPQPASAPQPIAAPAPAAVSAAAPQADPAPASVQPIRVGD